MTQDVRQVVTSSDCTAQSIFHNANFNQIAASKKQSKAPAPGVFRLWDNWGNSVVILCFTKSKNIP